MSAAMEVEANLVGPFLKILLCYADVTLQIRGFYLGENWLHDFLLVALPHSRVNRGETPRAAMFICSNCYPLGYSQPATARGNFSRYKASFRRSAERLYSVQERNSASAL